MSQMTNGRSAAGERPRFFPRQMIGPDDLTQLLNYLRERQRRHNRALHGWGVVNGALVLPTSDGKVKVTPGLILTPQGDEIQIVADCVLDPAKLTVGGEADPGHSEVSIDRSQPPSGLVYLAIRYQEFLDSPVRVPPVSCGCDDRPCEYSRLRDGYVFGILDKLPASHAADQSGSQVPAEQPAIQVASDVAKVFAADDKAKALLVALLNPQLPAAPVAGDVGWVVLAALQLSQNMAPAIDPVSPRRVLLSLEPVWWRPLPSITSVVPQTAKPDAGQSKVELVVTGKNLFPVRPADVTLSDAQVVSVAPNVTAFGEKLSVMVSYKNPGARKLTITNSGGASASFENVALVATAAVTPMAPASGGG